MDYVDSLIVKTTKLSSIDEGKLAKRKASIEDQIEFISQVKKEMYADRSKQRAAHIAGVVAISITVVSDVIMDAVAPQVNKANPLFGMTVGKVYKKARSEKFKGNLYSDEIAKVKKHSEQLEALLKLKGGVAAGQLKMVVEIHKNLAMNMIGLVGFDKDASDAAASIDRSIGGVEKLLKQLAKELDNTDFYLKTGEGPPKQAPMMTPARTMAPLG